MSKQQASCFDVAVDTSWVEFYNNMLFLREMDREAMGKISCPQQQQQQYPDMHLKHPSQITDITEKKAFLLWRMASFFHRDYDT